MLEIDKTDFRQHLEWLVDQLAADSAPYLEERPRFAHGVLVLTDHGSGEIMKASLIKQLDLEIDEHRIFSTHEEHQKDEIRTQTDSGVNFNPSSPELDDFTLSSPVPPEGLEKNTELPFVPLSKYVKKTEPPVDQTGVKMIRVEENVSDQSQHKQQVIDTRQQLRSPEVTTPTFNDRRSTIDEHRSTVHDSTTNDRRSTFDDHRSTVYEQHSTNDGRGTIDDQNYNVHDRRGTNHHDTTDGRRSTIDDDYNNSVHFKQLNDNTYSSTKRDSNAFEHRQSVSQNYSQDHRPSVISIPRSSISHQGNYVITDPGDIAIPALVGTYYERPEFVHRSFRSHVEETTFPSIDRFRTVRQETVSVFDHPRRTPLTSPMSHCSSSTPTFTSLSSSIPSQQTHREADSDAIEKAVKILQDSCEMLDETAERIANRRRKSDYPKYSQQYTSAFQFPSELRATNY
ncbi:unnamed protein product [Bursaphelenchus okinawaensis]|uniref:Uncharacterized protein n=1 Tax=Bursaphelenchus okinawaensis TaxID=465554 RepID=A0A811LBZ1_9BILA|nr:unnamed protein product [Bursaphelenchus okinawaensis]CAG9120092.1 unnamed protein product [Bursaphelenchus okinawaensis]